MLTKRYRLLIIASLVICGVALLTGVIILITKNASKPGTKYSCDQNSGLCVINPQGSWTNKVDCSKNCSIVPPPKPKPGTDCRSNGCKQGDVCAICNCKSVDTDVGLFGCKCDETGHASGVQQDCCGGSKGMKAWCRKGDHSLDPRADFTCNKGEPSPGSDYYEYLYEYRCVPRAASGTCDSHIPAESLTCPNP